MNYQNNPRFNKHVLVQALKFDGQIHRQWEARIVHTANSLVVLKGRFSEEIIHPLLGSIAQGTESLEYYWLDRWYSVFNFTGAVTSLCKFYCNINLPAKFDGRVLSFTDLDIDILVKDDFTFNVVDEDEFTINAQRLKYPANVRNNAKQAVREIIDLIENRHFPFNEKI